MRERYNSVGVVWCEVAALSAEGFNPGLGTLLP